MKAAGMDAGAIGALRRMPEPLLKYARNVSFTAGPNESGWYSGQLRSIHMNSDAQNWSGGAQTARHEFGHHVHFETQLITDISIDPGMEAAIAADVPVFEKWAESAMGPDWRTKTNDKLGFTFLQYVEKVYGVGHYDEQSKTVQKKLSSWADVVMGITKGRYGSGHEAPYMSQGQNGAMEAFSGVFSAILRDDKVFQKSFPNITDFLKKRLKL